MRQRTAREARRLNKIGINHVLESAAAGEGWAEMILYDEVSLERWLPPDWESPLIEALDRYRAARIEFRIACAEMLVTLASDWPGMWDLIVGLLRDAPSMRTLRLCARYAEVSTAKVPPSACSTIRDVWGRLPWWKRILFWSYDDMNRRFLRQHGLRIGRRFRQL